MSEPSFSAFADDIIVSFSLVEPPDTPKTAAKRTQVELMGGKFDGLILDTQSPDPTERAIASFLRKSIGFERIAVVETDTEMWVQLRPKSDRA
jgi:hypothetical protein